MRQAGRVAAAVRAAAAARIQPGALLRDVCAWAEDEIRRRGGQPAFPVQTSRNEVAAHYCPTADERTSYAHGDVSKIDIGVHVDGWVVDTATTVSVGGEEAGLRLVQGAQAALQAALRAAAPGVAVRSISTAIEQAVASHGLRGLRNLCGHGVGRWTVHGPPAVPNVAMDQPDRLEPGIAVAIEPFVTEGLGLVAERGAAQVFRFEPHREVGSGMPAGFADALRAFRGLPFARHQLLGFPAAEVDHALELLRSRRVLSGYAPLVETTGRPVAQAEHTLYVSDTGIEVLTL